MVAQLSAAVVAAAPPDNRIAVGTVTAVTDGSPTVQFRGTILQQVGVASGYTPAVGDIVNIIRQDASWLVTGMTQTDDSGGGGGPAAPMGVAVLNYIPPVQYTFGVNAFQQFPGASVPFTKHSPTTKVLARVEACGFAIAAGASYSWDLGVRLDTDYYVARFFFNNALIHLATSGTALLTGVPGGTYTAWVVVRVTAAPKQVGCNSLDFVCLTLQEVS